jgi:serine/threonine-protein kinase
MTTPGVQSQSGLRYRPIIALGQGGMADVLLSVGRGPSGFNKLVVLKTMRKELVTDEDLRQMFLEEARLSARLNHANVVQVYEVVDTALPCIIMEYLEGQAMSSLQREAGERFTLPLQLKVISETLSGLHYSHELKDYDGTPLNIVHRDVSPQNVFVTYDGVVKVLDFGIAKASDATSQTRTGVIKGKIAYMPREQLLNERTDRRADVYAVGCMLWHAAAGEKLWANLEEGGVMRALIEGNIPKPSEKRPVDPKLEAIILKALAPEPDERYATAADLRRDVDLYLAENSPKTSTRELGELISEVFAEQFEARKKHIHLALTAPRSEPSPPIPEGIEAIVQSATGVTANSVVTERKTQMIWTVGAAVLASVLAVVGMLVFFTWRGGRSDPAPTSTVVAPAQIAVRVTATPAGAVLTVDGNPLSGNPALLTVPVDSRDHQIRASLAGYEPYLKTVRFDHDMSLEITLQQPLAPATSASSANDKASTKLTAGTSGKKLGTVAAGGKKKGADCNPPFYFENGIKVYRPGCL